MLNELVRYSKRQGLAGPGFAPKWVRWAIQVSPAGKPGIVPLDDGSNKKNPGRQFDVCPEASGMNSGGKSHFLVETLETVFLMCKKEENRPKFKPKHDFFVKQLRDAADVCPEMGQFADIVESEEHRADLITQLQEAKAKPTDKITVVFEDRTPAFLVADTVWHDWWSEYRNTLGKPAEKPAKKSAAAKQSDGRMLCFATGEMIEPAKTHPKITELADVGASAMGASLVSFDKDATCSYGLKQSANAAMSEESAAAYRAGLNHVLAHHSRRLAGAKVAYWFDKRVPDDQNVFEPLLGGSNSKGVEEEQERDAFKRAKDLLAAISKGDIPDFVKDNHYYALTLSGNAGRVVVRDWITLAFGALRYIAGGEEEVDTTGNGNAESAIALETSDQEIRQDPPRTQNDVGTTRGRGRPRNAFTQMRANFAQERLALGETWAEILEKYQSEHPEDTEATSDIIRLAYNRNYPA